MVLAYPSGWVSAQEPVKAENFLWLEAVRKQQRDNCGDLKHERDMAHGKDHRESRGGMWCASAAMASPWLTAGQ